MSSRACRDDGGVVMAGLGGADRLAQLQAYGEERVVAAGSFAGGTSAIVQQALVDPHREAVAQGKRIVASLRSHHQLEPRAEVGHPAADVVVGADVIVGALSGQSPAVLDAFVDSGADLALILTEETVEQMLTALNDPAGLAWAFDEASQAAEMIVAIASGSGGGMVKPAWEVWLPSLAPAGRTALQAAASPDLGYPRVVVSADAGALGMSPWEPRGVPWPEGAVVTVMSTEAFGEFVDRARLA